MAITEIDEVELLNLRRLQGVASKIMQDPKGRRLLEQAQKLVEPNAPTPTLDQDASIHEPVNKALERVAELEKKLAEKDAENEKNAKLANLAALQEKGFAELKQSGWQQEGLDGIKKMMEDKGILNPIDAAAIFEKQHPQPQPVTPSGHGAWDFMDNVQDGEKDLKSLIESRGENNNLIDKMAREALADVRGQGRR